ncbi:MAG TPA: Uma2 family endonuclease [Mycobacteriales bacterium]|nr:Uma2 family endonuclease [Mycobacteriales bacterium]
MPTLLPRRPWGRPFTPEDLATLPGDGRRYEVVDGSLLVTPGPTRAELAGYPDDDGYRYELVDGTLLVTPAPSLVHQRAQLRLGALLLYAAPRGFEVLTSPFSVVPADDTEMQPDVLVAHKSDFTAADLPGAPLLAVEILSPSTRRFDLRLKKDRYARAGTAAYWVVDPAAVRLVAWHLRGGAYEQVADVTGDEAYAAEVPFPVTVTPSALVAD